MVSYRAGRPRGPYRASATCACFLDPGDLLVINTSGTINAALAAARADGTALELHLSTHLPADLWTGRAAPHGYWPTQAAPLTDPSPGEILALPAGGNRDAPHPLPPPRRSGAAAYGAALDRHARPAHAPATRTWRPTASPSATATSREQWPLSVLPDRLRHRDRQRRDAVGGAGVHAGVADPPGRARHPGRATAAAHRRGQPGRPRAAVRGVLPRPAETARLVNAAHEAGEARRRRRDHGGPRAGDRDRPGRHDTPWRRAGPTWSSLRERGVRAVNALLTGLHEPRSSHLAMLEALGGVEHLGVTYAAALREGYLWHEFGDLHLILP